MASIADEELAAVADQSVPETSKKVSTEKED